MTSFQDQIKQDPDYIQADETGKQYIMQESTSAQESLPEPSQAHREGEYIVHDPERYYYDTEDANALLDEASSGVRSEIVDAVSLRDASTSHHREVIIKDEKASEEIQDDALTESELIDMAQLRDDMNEPPMA